MVLGKSCRVHRGRSVWPMIALLWCCLGCSPVAPPPSALSQSDVLTLLLSFPQVANYTTSNFSEQGAQVTQIRFPTPSSKDVVITYYQRLLTPAGFQLASTATNDHNRPADRVFVGSGCPFHTVSVFTDPQRQEVELQYGFSFCR